MVQVVWRRSGRRMEIEGPAERRRQQRAERKAQSTAAVPGPSHQPYLPAPGSAQLKMQRYRALKLVEHEGLSLEVARARVATMEREEKQARAPRRGLIKSKRTKRVNKASVAKAGDGGNRKGGSNPGKRKVKKKRKAKSYPFFLFLRGGAPGSGKRS